LWKSEISRLKEYVNQLEQSLVECKKENESLRSKPKFCDVSCDTNDLCDDVEVSLDKEIKDDSVKELVVVGDGIGFKIM